MDLIVFKFMQSQYLIFHVRSVFDDVVHVGHKVIMVDYTLLQYHKLVQNRVDYLLLRIESSDIIDLLDHFFKYFVFSHIV